MAGELELVDLEGPFQHKPFYNCLELNFDGYFFLRIFSLFPVYIFFWCRKKNSMAHVAFRFSFVKLAFHKAEDLKKQKYESVLQLLS